MTVLRVTSTSPPDLQCPLGISNGEAASHHLYILKLQLAQLTLHGCVDLELQQADLYRAQNLSNGVQTEEGPDQTNQTNL